jgi:F-type H+-transporting ATPase subunit epsilon
MADTIQLQVLTPEGEKLNVAATEITARGALGEFGILPGHTYLVTRLEPCHLRYRVGGREESMEIGEGFARVGDDKMIMLVRRAGAGAAAVAEVAAHA